MKEKRYLYKGHGEYTIVHSFTQGDVWYWVAQRVGDNAPSLVVPSSEFHQLED